MKPRIPILLCVVVAAGAGACGPADVPHITLKRPAGVTRVVLMPPDIRVVQVTSLGLRIPVARWTRDAERHARAALRRELQSRGMQVREFAGAESPRTEAALTQIRALHHAAARSARRHRSGSRRLPARDPAARWTIGDRARVLGGQRGAEYALFLYLRDGYTSPGRVMQIALMAVRTGFVLPGGELHGYASLVELSSGDIVWLKTLSDGSGDLRRGGPAAKVIKELFGDFPR